MRRYSVHMNEETAPGFPDGKFEVDAADVNLDAVGSGDFQQFFWNFLGSDGLEAETVAAFPSGSVRFITSREL